MGDVGKPERIVEDEPIGFPDEEPLTVPAPEPAQPAPAQPAPVEPVREPAPEPAREPVPAGRDERRRGLAGRRQVDGIRRAIATGQGGATQFSTAVILGAEKS